MENSTETDHSSVTKPASKVMLGGIFSLVGGLAVNVIVASIFGAGKEMDAYLTAFVIPTYFQTVIFWNLSFVLIPIFIEMEVKDGEEKAWALVGTFFWITVFILLVIALIGSFFSSSIINAIAPGFGEEKSALAAQMLSILMFTYLDSRDSECTKPLPLAGPCSRYRFPYQCDHPVDNFIFCRSTSSLLGLFRFDGSNICYHRYSCSSPC